MKGRINSITYSALGNPVVAIEFATREIVHNAEIMDTDIDVTIKKHSERRSINANAYAWTLMSQIAEAITPTISKEEVYHRMLVRYGTIVEDENGTQIILSIRADVDLKNVDDYLYIHSGMVGKGYINGCSFNHYRVIKGSSEYTTAEMARFIDGIISECEELNIPTITGMEYESMMSAWGRKYEKHHTG